MSMAPGYIIRSACRIDMPALLELCRDHALYEGVGYETRDQDAGLSEAIFSKEPRIWCKVAENAGNSLVGYCTYMREYATWHAGYYLHMDCLYLRPEARDKGIGRGLMEEMIRHAGLLGVKEIQWQTPENNSGAIAFYERMGAAGKKKIRFFLNITNDK